MGNKGAPSLYEAFLFNLKDEIASGRVIPVQGSSKDVLLKFNLEVLQGTRKKYDFIYIDGAHDAKSVMEDAVLAWDLLKERGILIFDDYQMNGDSTSQGTPKSAIDFFMHAYVGKYELLHNAFQLHVRKNILVKAVDDNAHWGGSEGYSLIVLPLDSQTPVADQATVSTSNILPDHNWLGSDSQKSVISGMRILGTYHPKDGSKVGSISMKLRKGDRLFYRSGPTGGNQFLEIPESGKPPLTLPVSPEWVQLDFSSIHLPFGDFTVTLKNEGSTDGEWSAVAVKE